MLFYSFDLFRLALIAVLCLVQPDFGEFPCLSDRNVLFGIDVSMVLDHLEGPLLTVL